MTRAEVLRRLRKLRNKTLQGMIHAGIPLRYLDSGAFRHTYKVIGHPLIVKLPFSDYEPWDRAYERNFQWSVTHSYVEARSIKRVLNSRRKFRKLQPFMPKLYYYHGPSGMIVMHYYKTPNNRRFQKQVLAIQEEVRDTFGRELTKYQRWARKRKDDSYRVKGDVQPGNCGIDERGRLVILDLGLMESHDNPIEVNEKR